MKAKSLLYTALTIGTLGGCVQEDQYTQAYARNVREITRAACIDTLAFRRSFDDHPLPPSAVLNWATENGDPQGRIDLYHAREQCLIGAGQTTEPVGRAVRSSKWGREPDCDAVVNLGVIQHELYEAAGIRGRYQRLLQDADTYIADCRTRGFLSRE